MKNIVAASILLFWGVSQCHGQVGIFTDPRDAKTYKTIQIGNQTWMAENMRHDPYIISDSLYNQPQSSDFYFPICCYKGLGDNCKKYGKLYKYEAALKACPIGWHLPSMDEFEVLLNTSGSTESNIRYDYLVEGGGSGFDALLAGGQFREDDRYSWHYAFSGLGNTTLFWTTTIKEGDPRNPHRHYTRLSVYKGFISQRYRGVKFHDFTDDRDYVSVRCIKD